MKYKKIVLMTILISAFSQAEEIQLESLDFLQEIKDIESQEQPVKSNDFELNIDLTKISADLDKIESSQLPVNESEIIVNLKSIVKKIDPKFENATITKMKELEDFFEVNNNGEIIYIHKNGEYILPLIAKVTGNSFEDIQASKNKDRIKDELANFPKSSLISYNATKPIADIYVFSDYTCPYCKKFHNNLLEINNLGINVHYIPFPRNGIRDKNAISGLKNIVCSDIPTLEFDKAFENSKNYHRKISPLTYDCVLGKEALHNSLILGDKVKVKGTPFIYLSNGAYLGGWNGIRNFNALLGKELSKMK